MGDGDQRWRVDLVESLRERPVKVPEHALALEIARLDLVELPFHLRRESHVEDVGELFDHHLFDRLTKLRGEEALVLQFHLSAIGEHRDDRRVRRWTADPQPFELFHKRRFRESRRGFREMLCWRDSPTRYRLALLDLRQ